MGEKFRVRPGNRGKGMSRYSSRQKWSTVNPGGTGAIGHNQKPISHISDAPGYGTGISGVVPSNYMALAHQATRECPALQDASIHTGAEWGQRLNMCAPTPAVSKLKSAMSNMGSDGDLYGKFAEWMRKMCCNTIGSLPNSPGGCCKTQ